MQGHNLTGPDERPNASHNQKFDAYFPALELLLLRGPTPPRMLHAPAAELVLSVHRTPCLPEDCLARREQSRLEALYDDRHTIR